MSKTEQYSLEDIMAMQESEALAGTNFDDTDLEFGDDELDTPANLPQSPLLDDDDDDVEDLDPATPAEPVDPGEDGVETIEDPVVEPAPASTPKEEDPDNMDQLLRGSYEIMNTQGALLTNEDYEFDGTPDSFKVALEQTKDNLRKEVANEVWQIIPEIIKGKEQQYVADLSTLDLTDDEVQKQVVAEDLRINTRFSEDKIRDLVNRSEDLGMLSEEAAEAVGRLQEHQQELRQKAEAQAIEVQKAQQQEFINRRKTIQSAITESPNIHGNRKGKIEAFMFNEIKKGDENMSTQYHSTLKAIARNPQHEAELANLLLDSYNPEKGFNYTRLNKLGTTKQVDAFQEKLNDVFNRDKIKGNTPTTHQDKFDLEMWHKQHDGDLYE